MRVQLQVFYSRRALDELAGILYKTRYSLGTTYCTETYTTKKSIWGLAAPAEKPTTLQYFFVLIILYQYRRIDTILFTHFQFLTIYIILYMGTPRAP